MPLACDSSQRKLNAMSTRVQLLVIKMVGLTVFGKCDRVSGRQLYIMQQEPTC